MRIITNEGILGFSRYLRGEERAPATIEKYVRAITLFMLWLAGQAVTKDLVLAWKEHLQTLNYAPATVNGMIVGLNAFFKYCGWEDFHVRALRLQRRVFRDASRNLTKEEYERLVSTAMSSGKVRLALLLETLCSTGIRVSELQYITVAVAQSQRTEISLKGKIRTIMLPGKLCRKLIKYAKKNKIDSGEIFVTESGNSLTRQQIWAEMKALCQAAGVEPSKVFPHNLRHLFARTFYRATHDIVKLADMLGHSSIETTRLYLISTGEEHARTLDRLGLVS